jgi:hypothetical protein
MPAGFLPQVRAVQHQHRVPGHFARRRCRPRARRGGIQEQQAQLGRLGAFAREGQQFLHVFQPGWTRAAPRQASL